METSISSTTSDSNPIKISIVLPVRNEGQNIAIMVKILSIWLEVPHEILIVYDHPSDDCLIFGKELQKKYSHVRLVHNTLGPGVTNAIRQGVQSSKGEYILLFAVDEIGPVLAIDDMLALMEEGCALASCTRYAYGGRRLGGSKLGHFLSWLANKLFRWLVNSSLTDCTTGIKMFRRNLLDEIQLEARPAGWAVAFELAIKAQTAQHQLGEVPIVSIDRLFGGESTFRLGPWIKEYFLWFLWGLQQKFKGNIKNTLPVKVRIPNYHRNAMSITSESPGSPKSDALESRLDS